ncbi:MAG: hypothetical protein ABIT07_01640 [Ferruginibacter sp.]
MYKMDKSIVKLMSHEEAENENRFSPETSLAERLGQAWYLTCMAYGIDPEQPPKMDKTIFSMRKHAQ